MLSSSFDMQVPFYDVDSFRIVWHGNYPKYFEVARCQLLELIGYPYKKMEETGYFFPVIDLQVRYVEPIRFEQKIRVRAELVRWEDKLVIDYQIHDRQTKRILTKASTTQVAVQMPQQITQFKAPDELVQNVEQALAKAGAGSRVKANASAGIEGSAKAKP